MEPSLKNHSTLSLALLTFLVRFSSEEEQFGVVHVLPTNVLGSVCQNWSLSGALLRSE